VPMPQPRSAKRRGGRAATARVATHAVTRSSSDQRCPATCWRMRQSPASQQRSSPGCGPRRGSGDGAGAHCQAARRATMPAASGGSRHGRDGERSHPASLAADQW
jgi:hypothetical protein